MTLPVYAPSSIQFDKALLKQEIENHLLKHVKVNAIPTNKDSLYNPSFEIADETKINNTTCAVWNPETGVRQFIKKPFNSYETINLTFLPGIDESGYRNSFVVKGQQRFFRTYNPQAWRWREDLHTPHIKACINEFGFTQVTQVTCIVMRPPAIGLVHRDIYSNRQFYQDGFGSLSVIVSSGGGHLVVDVNGQQIQIEADGQAYHFDDSFMHGLTQTNELRFAYRVFGMIDQKKYLSHLDMSRAVWSGLN